MGGNVVGIDIGATNTRLAILNNEGEILERIRILSRMSDGESFFAEVGDLAANLADKSNARVVGIGTAGQIHKETGTYLPGLNPGAPWVGVPIQRIVQKKTGLPVLVDNDCKMSAYGELKVGCGQGLTDFVSLTLGTGIGGGIITNRQLVHGEKGLAGHLGHISIKPNGIKCYCGNVGCLENYVSGTAVERLATKVFDRKVNSKETFELAFKGNHKAQGVIRTTGLALGEGLAIMGNLLNPQAFILGGSIMEWHHLLKPSIYESFSRHVMADVKDTPILPSALGGDSGIIGAALYAWDNFQQ